MSLTIYFFFLDAGNVPYRLQLHYFRWSFFGSLARNKEKELRNRRQ